MSCVCNVHKTILSSVVLTTLSLFATAIYIWSLNMNSEQMFKYLNSYNEYLDLFMTQYPEYTLTVLPSVVSPLDFYYYGWSVAALCFVILTTVPIVLRYSNISVHPKLSVRLICYFLLVAAFLTIDIWAAIYSHSFSALYYADVPVEYNQYLSGVHNVDIFHATRPLAPPLVISLINIIWLYMLLMGTIIFYPLGIFGYIHDHIKNNRVEISNV